MNEWYCAPEWPDLPPYDELHDAVDDELFSKAKNFSNHVLHPLLPPPSAASQRYKTRTFTFTAATRYPNIQLISHTTISLYVCCAKTHIRLTYPSLDRNILLTLIYNIFDITFLLVCRITQLYKPAFCHAFIKRILIDWLIELSLPSLRGRQIE